MARREGINIPLRNYSGSDSFGPVELLPGEHTLFVELAHCTTANPTIWPNYDTILTITCELSVDGGTNWEPSGSTISRGGIQVSNWNGLEVPVTVFSTGLRPAPQRHFRVNFSIANGPLRTSGTVGLVS